MHLSYRLCAVEDSGPVSVLHVSLFTAPAGLQSSQGVRQLCDYYVVLSYIFCVFMAVTTCSSILLPRSVSIFMTVILNSLSGKLLPYTS